MKKEPFKVVNEYTQNRRISKDLTIRLGNGDEIMVNKSVYENDNEYEPDWEIIEGQEIYDKMSADEQDDFSDFINDYDLYENE